MKKWGSTWGGRHFNGDHILMWVVQLKALKDSHVSYSWYSVMETIFPSVVSEGLLAGEHAESAAVFPKTQHSDGDECVKPTTFHWLWLRGLTNAEEEASCLDFHRMWTAWGAEWIIRRALQCGLEIWVWVEAETGVNDVFSYNYAHNFKSS